MHRKPRGVCRLARVGGLNTTRGRTVIKSGGLSLSPARRSSARGGGLNTMRGAR